MTKSNKIRILQVVLVVGKSWASNGINFGLKDLHLAVRALPWHTVPVGPIKSGLNVPALDHFFGVLYSIGTPKNLAANFFSCRVLFILIFLGLMMDWWLLFKSKWLGSSSPKHISASRIARKLFKRSKFNYIRKSTQWAQPGLHNFTRVISHALLRKS